MRTEEARALFGLKDNDKLNTDGILSLIKSTQEHLGTWSLGIYDRAKAEKELEALMVLYKESLKGEQA